MLWVAMTGALAAAAAVDGRASDRFGTVDIAPPEAALTFARIAPSGTPRVIAVASYQAGRVAGVDLSALLGRDVGDPIAVLDAVGYDALRDRIVAAIDDARVAVSARDLVLPIDLGNHHIAAGTNYPEHADEAEVEDGPFLFAKLVEPTAPFAPVPAGDALLDYEVELAWVTLAPLAARETPTRMGLVLCNDYTDRATLLRHVDAWDPTSGKGFATGKSFPGYLPVGTLFVVPRDVREFAAALELHLWVNGELRQRAPVAAQVWDLDEMLAATWARRAVTWEHRGTRVSLLAAGDTIPARTLLMSGTPGGTVFAGVDMRARASGVLAWLGGGWQTALTTHVVEAYIGNARAAARYLQPGDRVTIHVERLGVIENEIVP
jgi:2-keto-4-pentenoate hydratase/2-oxohepta-3-ene-1,7-dioic acid hydratase in catechol pathway